jgi:hypothetical protein
MIALDVKPKSSGEEEDSRDIAFYTAPKNPSEAQKLCLGTVQKM